MKASDLKKIAERKRDEQKATWEIERQKLEARRAEARGRGEAEGYVYVEGIYDKLRESASKGKLELTEYRKEDEWTDRAFMEGFCAAVKEELEANEFEVTCKVEVTRNWSYDRDGVPEESFYCGVYTRIKIEWEL